MSPTEAVRSTVYLAPDLHHALRLKAAHSKRSMSDIVNEALRQALREDQEDLAALRNRVAEDLRGTPKADVQRILARIEGLRDDPRAPG